MAKPIFDIGQICELDKWETFINGQPFELFERLTRNAPIELRKHLESAAKYASEHRDIITKFGRFPHRNAVLGRESTPEESTFLESSSRFGQ